MRPIQAPKEFKNQSHIRYDTRDLLERFTSDFLSDKKQNAPILILSFCLGGFLIPGLLFPFILVGFVCFLIMVSSHEALPMKLPMGAKGYDYNSPYPGGRTAYRKAEGIFLLGYEEKTGEQVWASATEILRHMLILGVTGAGKTEALLGIVANSLGIGAGAIYCDAKATIKLLWQIYALSCITGRVDDFHVINYITGGLSQHKIKEIGRITNSVQPFAIGSADGILQLLTSLMPAGGGGNEVFRERAIAIMAALLKAMEELRDKFNQPISAESIRNKLDLKVFSELAKGTYGTLSPETSQSVEEYLKKLPGWVDGVPIEEQAEQVSQQFGFAQMYWTRSLGQLADSYKHIYGDSHGEVDFADIVLNRRILLVMLPALEKSSDELGQLGKLNLAALKGAMSIGLGMRVQGKKQDVLDPLPAAEQVPSIGIFDEYGYMAAPGFAVSAAQARGLGFGAIFAGQGLAGFQALNPGESGRIEVDQIIDNTRLKIAMGIEDADKSFSLFQKIAGEMEISKESNFEMDALGNAIASRKSSIQREQRLHIRDVRDQIEGEAHVMWTSKIIRMDFFHADPQIPKKAAVILNHGIKVDLERPDQLEELLNEIKNRAKTVDGFEASFTPSPHDTLISLLCRTAEKEDDTDAVSYAIRVGAAFLEIATRKQSQGGQSSTGESSSKNRPMEMDPSEEELVENPMGISETDLQENPEPEFEHPEQFANPFDQPGGNANPFENIDEDGLMPFRRETIVQSLTDQDIESDPDANAILDFGSFETRSPGISDLDSAVETLGDRMGLEPGIPSLDPYPTEINRARNDDDEADLAEIDRMIKEGMGEEGETEESV